MRKYNINMFAKQKKNESLGTFSKIYRALYVMYAKN